MEDTNEEFRRVLDNPSNVILSDDLQEIFSVPDDVEDDQTQVLDNVLGQPCLLFKGVEIIFQISKIKRITNDTFVFTGASPNFPTEKFIEGEKFDLKYFDSHFYLDERNPVEYRANGSLTFTARRIFKNEEV